MNKVETVMCDAAPGRALPPVIFLKTFCGFDLFEGPGNYTIGTSSHSLVCGERPESYDRIAPSHSIFIKGLELFHNFY